MATKVWGNVEEYKFQNFAEVEADSAKVKEFEFKPLLSSTQALAKSEFQKIIKDERENARHNQFKVNPIVEKFRGLKDQEEREYHERVELDVAKRIAEIQEEAFKAGFEEGVNQGREEIFNEMRNVVDQKLDNFSEMINNVLHSQEDLIEKQKKEVYTLIRNLTKWIITRELKDDGAYIERLLERLLLEIQARQNLLIQVGQADFNSMPEVLNHVQSRLGELKNVRVEMDSSMKTRGMVIETDNGIVNANLEEQFRNLDKLFEDVLGEA